MLNIVGIFASRDEGVILFAVSLRSFKNSEDRLTPLTHSRSRAGNVQKLSLRRLAFPLTKAMVAIETRLRPIRLLRFFSLAVSRAPCRP